MSDTELMQQLKDTLASIRHIGENIEEESVKSNIQTTKTLKSSKELSAKYLGQAFSDSFNI